MKKNRPCIKKNFLYGKILIIFFFLCYSIITKGETTQRIHSLKHAYIDANNLASLQRGVKYFMNFCSGCHSLRFMSYNRLAADLKITEALSRGSLNQRLKKNLNFTDVNSQDFIKSGLLKKNALLWFGRQPPDLSLSTRAKSIDWVYNYLLKFYPDKTRPYGVNNHLIKNTVMPDALTILRNKAPNYQLKNNTDSSNYKTLELEEVVTDLVNFLAYVAEPTKKARQSLGFKVCFFLLFFLYLIYLLKKQIWGNVK